MVAHPNVMDIRSKGERNVKKASKFEKIAARCWNLLNEGKPFTPIFVIGTMLLFHLLDGMTLEEGEKIFHSFLLTVPLFVLYYIYDYPLFLRNYLWIPYVIFLMISSFVPTTLLLLAVSLYFFLPFSFGEHYTIIYVLEQHG